MHTRIALLILLCVAVAQVPASAGTVLYNNGPINGTMDAWALNFGYIISDTITLAQTSAILGFDMGVWEFPGDKTLTIDWSITSGADGGTLYGKGTATVTDTFISLNQYGYDIDKLSATISGPTLNVGTYWLNMQNAVTQEGNPLYWDENSGVGCTGDDGKGGGCPSAAACCGGTIPSESFEITGTSSGSQTPEPSDFVLFGSGILGMVGILRYKRRKSN